jgi:hypothetical protein
LAAAGVLAAGCARATTACKGPAATICLNGHPLAFAAGNQPHGHEVGNLYAPVDVLAKQLHLDVKSSVSADGKKIEVLLNGKPFAPAMADGAKGVHVHNGQVYVPVREFAAAAGLKLQLDAATGVAGVAQ